MELALVAMAGGRVHLQRVHVEEALAVHRHARQHGVVQGQLHDVRIFRHRADLQHTAGEERERDRRAGLRIRGVVRQVVVIGERFADVCAADAAGDVQLAVHDVAPQPIACGQQVGVAGQAGHVGHARVEVGGTHRMPDGLSLLDDRLVRLIVGVRLGQVRVRFDRRAVEFGATTVLGLEIQRRAPAFGDEVARQVQIPAFTGGLVQPHKRHLGDLMPRIAAQLALVASENGVHVVGVTAGGPEQLVLAGALVVGHGALDQMPQAVQFVVVLQVGERAVHAVEDVVGVQVAVVQLGVADDVDGGVGSGLEFGIGVLRQAVADRFDPLGEVGVLEHEAIERVRIGVRGILRQRLEAAKRVGRGHERLALGGLGRVLARGGLEVVHAVAGGGTGHVVVQRVPLEGDDRGAHQLLFGVPERVGHGDAGHLQRTAVLCVVLLHGVSFLTGAFRARMHRFAHHIPAWDAVHDSEHGHRQQVDKSSMRWTVHADAESSSHILRQRTTQLDSVNPPSPAIAEGLAPTERAGTQ